MGIEQCLHHCTSTGVSSAVAEPQTGQIFSFVSILQILHHNRPHPRCSMHIKITKIQVYCSMGVSLFQVLDTATQNKQLSRWNQPERQTRPISQLVSCITAKNRPQKISVTPSRIARKQTFATVKYRKYAPLTWLSSRAMSL